MFEIKCITFALWINTLCNNVITENKVSDMELSPKDPVKHLGEELKLTCNASFCRDNVIFTWATAIDDNHGGEPKNDQKISYLLIRNISVRHENSIICKVSCGGVPKQKTSKIHVYSFPQDPVVDKLKSLRANQEQKLNCTVHNIYPLERLTIDWFIGDHESVADLDLPNSDHVRNYSTLFKYTPSVDDLGKNITCKAMLELSNGTKITRESTAEYGPGNMNISHNTSVKLGERLEISCHADGNPTPTIQWWKLEETGAALRSQNQKLIINNASWSQAGLYQCNASNAVGNMQMKVKVVVLGPPSSPKIHLSHSGDPKKGQNVTKKGLPTVPKINLSHSGEPEEGENVTIFCSSDGDDRPAELTLYSQSRNVTGGLNESTVRLHIQSIQMADEGIYVCDAKNAIGSQSSQINIRVKAQQITMKMPDLPMAIVPAVGSLSLLTMAGFLIRFLKKKYSPVT